MRRAMGARGIQYFTLTKNVLNRSKWLNTTLVTLKALKLELQNIAVTLNYFRSKQVEPTQYELTSLFPTPHMNVLFEIS